jgi:hypothetical protein
MTVQAMLCDIHPEHGYMQIEPMYGTDGKTIMQYGWFCPVKGCDGYGGPVHAVKVAKEESGQIPLFETGGDAL